MIYCAECGFEWEFGTATHQDREDMAEDHANSADYPHDPIWKDPEDYYGEY